MWSRRHRLNDLRTAVRHVDTEISNLTFILAFLLLHSAVITATESALPNYSLDPSVTAVRGTCCSPLAAVFRVDRLSRAVSDVTSTSITDSTSFSALDSSITSSDLDSRAF